MNFKNFILNFIYKYRHFFTKMYFCFFFYWLPVKKNKIVFMNYRGCGYGCNPKYIAAEIIKQKLPYEIVWLANPSFIDKTNFPLQIRLVNLHNIRETFFELATSKIWIDNMRKSVYIKKGLRKKKNQIYINTWHGSLGIKKLDSDVKNFVQDKEWLHYAKKDSKMMDIMISNSDFETNIYKNALWFEGKIVKTGHPRNDIFFKENKGLKEKIFKEFNIALDKKTVLYVPSFRDNLRIDCFNLDYKLLKDTLEEKTGEKWEILSKFHPRNLSKIQYLYKSDYRHDVSFYPDIQELLYVSDIVISDYSSCMFDFMLSKKPCFIYAEDIKEYNNERGFYYPLESTPFPVAQSNNELVKKIKSFNYEEYKINVEDFLKNKNVLEDGNASKRAVKIIKNLIEGRKTDD